MAKRSVALFVTLLISFGYFDAVKTEESLHHHDQDEDVDRSAYAHASVSMRPLLPLGGFQNRVQPLQVQMQPGQVVIGQQTPQAPQQGLVQCYACVDCPEVQVGSPKKWCPRSTSQSHQSCVTYTEKYKHLTKGWVIRGCVSERGTCSDIKQAHSSNSDIVKLDSCNECEGNLCNSASRSDLTIAILSLLVAPLILKATIL